MLPSLLALTLLALTLLGPAAPPDSPATTASASARVPLGLNLSGVRDYSTEFPFVDVWKMSRAWVSQADGKPWGKGGELAVDERGDVVRLNPGQFATTPLFTGGGHPPGKYVLTWAGRGRVEVQGRGRVDSDRNRLELDVPADRKLFVHLRETDPADPARDFHLWMPGAEPDSEPDSAPGSAPESAAAAAAAGGTRFHAGFLDRVRRFSVVRFMDWMETNGSEVETWDDRPRVEDARWTTHGVPLEVMVDLANTAGVDPWFCVPHLADDDYVRRFAGQVRDTLDPARTVYVEHSNEVWNRKFAQAKYAAERGLADGLSDNPFQASLYHHARRSAEVFAIWTDVLGDDRRLVRVLGSQSANPWVGEQLVTWIERNIGPVAKHADAVAIAPYFGGALGKPDTAAQVAAMPLDAVFDELRASIAENEPKIEAVAALCRNHDLKLLAYEGGQHLVGTRGAENNQALMQKLFAANRDDRMEEMYTLALESWQRAGGDLYCLFASVSKPSKWGSWGLLESGQQDPATAPKWRAAAAWLEGR